MVRIDEYGGKLLGKKDISQENVSTKRCVDAMFSTRDADARFFGAGSWSLYSALR